MGLYVNKMKRSRREEKERKKEKRENHECIYPNQPGTLKTRLPKISNAENFKTIHRLAVSSLDS